MTQRIPLLPQDFLLQGGTLEDLKTKFAIDHSRSIDFPNLVQLKYSMIDSPLAEPLVQQCRGLILDETNGWACVAWPFNKFFNYGEALASPIDWTKARVTEKLDGSLIILYFYAGEWRAATSGTPDASGEVGMGSGLTFAQLFWRVFKRQDGWKKQLDYLTAQGSHNITIMFELTSPLNRVVVKHKEESLKLIGLRNRTTGKEIHIRDARCFEPVREFYLGSLDAAIATFDLFNPLEQEGYVVCDSAFNRIKVKHPGYVALHHLRGDGFGPKRALELTLKGEVGEILANFPEWTPLFERVAEALSLATLEVEKVWGETKGLPDQKSFALVVKDHKFSGILFALRKGKIEAVRDGFRGMHLPKLVELLGLREGAGGGDGN